MRNGKAHFVALVAAMIALAAGVITRMMAQETRTAEPVLAPDAVTQVFATRLTDARGNPEAFAQWKGKTLVINFWATWCPPCRQEIPAFSRLQGKYASNGVQFVGIALDTSDNILNYAKQNHVSYPLFIAEEKGAELSRQLGNSRLALPYTVVVDPKGEPRLTRLGRVSEQELDTLLHKITSQ